MLIPYTPLGRQLGEERVCQFARRFGRFALMSEPDLEKADGWFKRHGEEGILLGRLVPGLGASLSVPAGLERMPVWLFAAYNAAMRAAWNAAVIVLV